MDAKEIREKISFIIKPYVREESLLASMTDDTKLREDLNVNSARFVDIILSIEDDFDIEVPDDETGNLNKIGDLINLIQAKL